VLDCFHRKPERADRSFYPDIGDYPAFSIGGSQTGLLDSMKGAVTGNATFNFQPVVIDNVQIEVKPDLKPGDRVLVAWGGRKEMIG